MRSVRGCVSVRLGARCCAVVDRRRARSDAADGATDRSARRAKPGLRDAGEAARNMELIASAAEAGRLLRSEGAGRRRRRRPERDPTRCRRAADREPTAPRRRDRRLRVERGSNFANSDLAFSGNHVFVGNFHGFNTYDIERPRSRSCCASVVCPGGQGDVSVHGNLLFMSVEQTRGRARLRHAGRARRRSAPSASAASASSTSATCSKPKQVAAVQTCRGSHTHTLVTDPNDKANLYVYGSGTGAVRSGEELAGCSGVEPEGGSEHRALQHRRHPGAARGARRRRRSSTGRASSPTRRPARSPACGRAATTAPARRRRA